IRNDRGDGSVSGLKQRSQVVVADGQALNRRTFGFVLLRKQVLHFRFFGGLQHAFLWKDAFRLWPLCGLELACALAILSAMYVPTMARSQGRSQTEQQDWPVYGGS